MVKIAAKFTKAEIKKLMLDKKQRLVDVIIFNLNSIGEQFVINARANKTYKDRTGNLRSSIGYVVMFNGAQLNENFSGTVNGVKFAKKAIAEIKQKYPTGIVLICVAGADYALYVESKGYDVISGASLQAESDLKKAIKKIQLKIK